MPIREYICQECNNIQEYLIFHDEDIPSKCDKCGGKLKPIISLSSFHLKGTGWYQTDYKNKGKKKEKAGKEENKN